MEQLWPDVAGTRQATAWTSTYPSSAVRWRRTDACEPMRRATCSRSSPGELDLHRFEQLAAEGREALARGNVGWASEKLRAALGLWSGEPLQGADLDGPGVLLALEEQRLGALEDRIEADLELGRHPDLVAELRQLVGLHPLRERLRGQLMLSLSTAAAARQRRSRTIVRPAPCSSRSSESAQPRPAGAGAEDPLPGQLARPLQASTSDAPGPGQLLHGRVPELSQLTELRLPAATFASVTLTGPGGIGKTRLALQAASQLAGSCGRRPLRRPRCSRRSWTRRRCHWQRSRCARRCRRAHRRQALLLVLDNCEHVLEAAVDIATCSRAARS